MADNRSPTAEELNNVKQDTVQWPAKAHRVTPIDSDGGEIGPSNPLPVEIPPLISEINSTSTPLGADEVFTGEPEEINGYGIIYVNTYSDVASAVDGLQIEQSSDGTNWDHCDEFSIGAGSGKNFSINPYAKYLRITYTNGAIAQTEFRLQTIYKANGLDSSHRIQDSISTDDDAKLVKSVITGEDPEGTFRNVSTTVDGDLTISDNSSGFAIAKGDVTGHSAVQKFGNAPDFDSGDGEVTIWDGAEDGQDWEQMNYVYSTTADIDSISSTDAGDTQLINIQGLDENYELVVQDVTLDGQNRVALTTPLIRIFRAYNNNSVNLTGHVIVYVNGAISGGVPTDSTNIRAIIDPINQQTEMAVYTVPAGKTGYLTRGYASTSGGNRNTNYVIRFKAREFGKVFRLQNVNAISSTATSIVVLDYFVPLKIPEKTDLEVTAETSESAITGSGVSAGFDLVLVDN